MLLKMNRAGSFESSTVLCLKYKMVFNKLMCQTLYALQFTKHMGNKPGVFQHVCTNFYCCHFSLMLNTFSPSHSHNATAVLTVHGATTCNLIFELSAAVVAISDQQTETGNIVAQTCKMLPWTSSTYYIVCVSVFLPQLPSLQSACVILCCHL